MQAYFSQGMVEKAIRSLLEMEEFCAGMDASGVSLNVRKEEWDADKRG
jgi:hypothetical protein